MDPASYQPNACVRSTSRALTSLNLVSACSSTTEQLQLLDLPPELLGQIAAHHSTPEDLHSFSNASSLLRDVSYPLRYKEITLGWAIGVDQEGEIDIDSLLQLKKTVREMSEDLARDARKAEVLKTLRILEYGWYGQEEWTLLKQVLERATVLETVQMVRLSRARRAPHCELTLAPPSAGSQRRNSNRGLPRAHRYLLAGAEASANAPQLHRPAGTGDSSQFRRVRRPSQAD